MAERLQLHLIFFVVRMPVNNNGTIRERPLHSIQRIQRTGSSHLSPGQSIRNQRSGSGLVLIGRYLRLLYPPDDSGSLRLRKMLHTLSRTGNNQRTILRSHPASEVCQKIRRSQSGQNLLHKSILGRDSGNCSRFKIMTGISLTKLNTGNLVPLQISVVPIPEQIGPGAFQFCLGKTMTEYPLHLSPDLFKGLCLFAWPGYCLSRKDIISTQKARNPCGSRQKRRNPPLQQFL